MKPGDIYWVEIPGANGHEQAGRRPAIILQGSQLTSRLTTVQIIPLTSRTATTDNLAMEESHPVKRELAVLRKAGLK